MEISYYVIEIVQRLQTHHRQYLKLSLTNAKKKLESFRCNSLRRNFNPRQIDNGEKERMAQPHTKHTGYTNPREHNVYTRE